jgi:predicted N-acetyltransferase YhbS
VIEIRPLRRSDDRGGFSCGAPDLDRFLALYAGQNQFKHHIGVTHVAVEDEKVLGYATVAAANIEIEDIPAALKKRLPGYPLPVLRLARLAVDASVQGRGLGKSLLRHVFSLAHTMAELVGCVGVVVDVKEEAIAFYKRLGFKPMELSEGATAARPKTTSLFLPLKAIPKP